MTIKQGSKVKVTLDHSHISGALGEVIRTPDGYSELYLIRTTNGQENWLFAEEFELYTPPINLLKEKIETKIEEWKESLPPKGERLVNEEEWEAFHIIEGLRLALDILNEEE